MSQSIKDANLCFFYRIWNRIDLIFTDFEYLFQRSAEQDYTFSKTPISETTNSVIHNPPWSRKVPGSSGIPWSIPFWFTCSLKPFFKMNHFSPKFTGQTRSPTGSAILHPAGAKRRHTVMKFRGIRSSDAALRIAARLNNSMFCFSHFSVAIQGFPQPAVLTWHRGEPCKWIFKMCFARFLKHFQFHNEVKLYKCVQALNVVWK